MRQVNVEGVIHATRAVMGGMRARRYGRIVNVSSVAAIGTALTQSWTETASTTLTGGTYGTLEPKAPGEEDYSFYDSLA